MRRVSLVLGVAAVAVGAWSLRHVRTSTLLCTPHSTSTSGYGLSNGCLNQVWLEYLSFALILGGAIVATIAFMLLKRGRTAHREAGRPELRLLGTPGESPELRHLLGEQLTTLPAPTSAFDKDGIERIPHPRREQPGGSRQVS